ncbi:hypothetical protein BDW02DRAFT_639155 [Decorospora gaudefroyi]|uniref:Cell wall mannoprotein PIR1-like C-terminal domain-containing protein n=1 Tax=Decorospora gaudefroyi TaxID=184978 RepID=A0A6A5KFL8_9PLEO|nr:hypothetical protein BDW02DRAFT_639155 [Decorospora gaudefroyi]
MRTSTFLAPLFLAATSLAQGPPEGVEPKASAPEGCKRTVDGTFVLGTLENPSLRRRETAQEATDVICTLEDGILHDQYNRTGSIVANRQFQFDGPPQAGAIYTGGFSVCANNSLAIGDSTRWWRCMSGAFGNLYDQWIGAQCHEIRIQAIFPETSSTSSSAMSSTTSAPLSGSTSLISASKTSGLTSVSRSMHSESSATASSSVTGTADSDSDSEPTSTSTPDAPPEGAASSLSVAPFAIFAASMVFLGAALAL